MEVLLPEELLNNLRSFAAGKLKRKESEEFSERIRLEHFGNRSSCRKRLPNIGANITTQITEQEAPPAAR